MIKMMLNKRNLLAILAVVTIAAAALSSAVYYTTAQTPAALSGASIAQALNAPIVIQNNQTGIITAVLLRQTPNIPVSNQSVNNFTLANSVIDFMPMPNATSNQTMYVRGFFSLLENETNPVLRQAINYNWTILNLHSFMVGDTPKLQFLHWQTIGNLSTILANINNVTTNTTINNNKAAMTPQTALNATFIGAQLNGTALNGLVVDVLVPRKDVNITSALAPGIVLNNFVSMGTSFEFMALPNATTTNATATNATTTQVNATTGNVTVMGDFALKDNEVAAVEKVLIGNSTTMPGITNVTITAVHNHMLSETPKMTFVHFDARGNLTQILTLINMALNQTTIRGNATTTTPTSPSATAPTTTPSTPSTTPTSPPSPSPSASPSGPAASGPPAATPSPTARP